MKKIFLSIILCVFLFPMMVKAIELPEITNHEKVIIYIFRGHGCTHCYDALEFFYKYKDTYQDYFEVVTYEVWNNQANSELMNAVSAEFDEEVTGVPYIVIGEKYSNNTGFSSEMSDEIVEAALNAYSDSEYVDVVKKVAKNYKDSISKNLEESCKDEGIIHSKYETIIAFSIITVVVGLCAILIKFATK